MIVVARLLSGVLFAVSATDPVTLFVLAALLTVVAFTACFVPTRRALRLDPVKALHHE